MVGHAIGVGIGAWVIFVVMVVLLGSIFWIVEIIDVARREFRDPTIKIVWLLVIIFTHLLGAILYFFIGKSQGYLPGQTPPNTTPRY